MKKVEVNQELLESCFNMAKAVGANYIGIAIATAGQEGIEVIINPRANFDKKLEYYKEKYTEDLALKSWEGIRIVGFAFGNKFNEIQAWLKHLDI